MKISKYWTYIVLIIVSIILGSFVKSCSNPFKKQETNDVVKTDTIYRTVVIEAKQGNFQQYNPRLVSQRPIIINGKDNSDLQNYLLQLTQKIEEQSANDIRLNERLIKALERKTYKEIKEDSVVKITVNSTVEDGKQTYLGIDYKVKESYFKTYNTVTTIKKYSKYTLSAGVGLTSILSQPLEFNNQIIDSIKIPSKVFVTPLLAFKNRKGLEYQIEIGIDKNIKIGSASLKIKKDIFKKY